jgi:formate dehydrogenase major subunit
MGIWERPPAHFLDRLQAEFGFSPPRENGYDTVDAIRALRDGRAKIFIGLGGNFVQAAPDTEVTSAALRRAQLTVHISTKINRSHLTCGATALILPTLGRTEVDVQASGPQFVSVEDATCSVHASRGPLKPASTSAALGGLDRHDIGRGDAWRSATTLIGVACGMTTGESVCTSLELFRAVRAMR